MESLKTNVADVMVDIDRALIGNFKMNFKSISDEAALKLGSRRIHSIIRDRLVNYLD